MLDWPLMVRSALDILFCSHPRSSSDCVTASLMPLSVVTIFTLALLPNAFAAPPSRYRDCDRVLYNIDLGIKACTEILAAGARRYSSFTAYINRAIGYNEKGDTDRALADLDQALRLNPQSALVYLNRAKVHSRREDFGREVADLTRAIQLDPKYALAYSNRGAAYQLKGSHDLARADYLAAIELAPNDKRPLTNLALLSYELGDYVSAIELCDAALRIDPNDFKGRYFRSGARYKRGDFAQALSDIDTLEPAAQKAPIVLVRRGLILRALGRGTEALSQFNEALAAQADNISALWARGQLYEAQGLSPLALADYRLATSLPLRRYDDKEAFAAVTARMRAVGTSRRKSGFERHVGPYTQMPGEECLGRAEYLCLCRRDLGQSTVPGSCGTCTEVGREETWTCFTEPVDRQRRRDIYDAGNVVNVDGLSKAAQSLSKKDGDERRGEIAKNYFPWVKGSPAVLNELAKIVLFEILGNPDTSFSEPVWDKKVGGTVVDAIAPDGRGIRYGTTRESPIEKIFIGFRQPNEKDAQ